MKPRTRLISYAARNIARATYLDSSLTLEDLGKCDSSRLWLNLTLRLQLKAAMPRIAFNDACVRLTIVAGHDLNTSTPRLVTLDFQILRVRGTPRHPELVISLRTQDMSDDEERDARTAFVTMLAESRMYRVSVGETIDRIEFYPSDDDSVRDAIPAPRPTPPDEVCLLSEVLPEGAMASWGMS